MDSKHRIAQGNTTLKVDGPGVISLAVDEIQVSPLAVHGQGLHFYFDREKKSPILKDFDIDVPKGIIYSLLGPSGCGKTTLLKCVIGQHKIQEGSLKIFGRAPGSRGSFIPGRGVGYMPQDLALYLEMTTEEALSFFGALYLMGRQQITERVSFLVELLALPDQKRQIKHLSGGQQRRVSFAIALIHKPPLLILDEPTVGVDPLLRQAIWKHLGALANNERLTIIITTHYIEEARQAHVVGLMRDGRLLAEGNPEDLIKKYQAITLEDVFLRLCQNRQSEEENCETKFIDLQSVETSKQSHPEQKDTVWVKKGKSEIYKNGMKTIRPIDVIENGDCEAFGDRCDDLDNTTSLLSSSNVPKEIEFSSSCSRSFVESCKRLSCLSKKNFLRLRRNTLFLLFQMFFPALQAVVFYLCIGADPFDLTIAVTNVEEDPNGYGKVFLNSLSNRTFNQKHYENITTAIESVKTGESWAALYIGPEFTSCILDRVLDGVDAVNETIMCGNIKIYFDMSNKQIAASIYIHFILSFQTFAKDMIRAFGKNPMLAEPPLLVQEPIYGSIESTYTEYIAPGMMLGIIYIMAVALAEMAIILEKKQGIYERTLVAGATSTEVFLSLFVVLLFSLVTQVTLVIITSFVIFHLPCNGPLIWAIIGIFLAGLGGMTFGLFVSSICTDENFAVIIAVGSFYTQLLLSGVVWPLEAMPHILRYISYCLPLTLLTESLRSILSRGWDVTEYHTYSGFLVSTSWIVLFMVSSMILFKIKK